MVTSELKSLGVVEGLRYQEINEVVIYTITTTKSLSGPTGTTVVATDEQDDATVTTTIFPNTVGTPHSISGDVITLSPLEALTANHTYRISVAFTDGTSTHYCYFRIKAVEI